MQHRPLLFSVLAILFVETYVPIEEQGVYFYCDTTINGCAVDAHPFFNPFFKVFTSPGNE